MHERVADTCWCVCTHMHICIYTHVHTIAGGVAAEAECHLLLEENGKFGPEGEGGLGAGCLVGSSHLSPPLSLPQGFITLSNIPPSSQAASWGVQ